jgi:hypothetical protein
MKISLIKITMPEIIRCQLIFKPTVQKMNISKQMKEINS